MDSNYGDVQQSFKMSSQAPLDSKSMVNRITDLTDNVNEKAFTYYRGMKVFCHQDKKTYEWTDNLVSEQTKLLPENFVYPTGSEYDGINYSGLEFNFVEIISVYTPYVAPAAIGINSVGNGVPVFNGFNSSTKSNDISSLKTNTLSMYKISEDNESKGSILIDYKKTVNKSPGGSGPLGVTLVDETENNFEVWSLEEGDGVKIEKDETKKTVKVSSPTAPDETIKQFYVNADYTGGGASFEGNGSILKPYKKLTYALRDIIGNGYACAPQFPNSVINLLSDVTVLQSDLDAVPKLNNRLSVQSTTISSSGETRYSIVYDGSSDYPFDTKSLCEEALTVFGGGASGVSLQFQIKVGFNNVALITTKTTGIIRSWSYDGHNKFDGTEHSSRMTLNDVLFYSRYNTENYSVYKKLTDYQGNNLPLYGSDIYGQDTENNLPPHMLVYGLGNVKEGQHHINNLYASGLSATIIKIERTTVNFHGNTTIVQNSHRMPVQSLNPSNPGEYLPKNDIVMIEMDSSWVRFEKLDHKFAYPQALVNLGGNIAHKLIGGYNSFFSVKKTYSISPHYTIQTGGGQFLSGILNYFITIDTTNAHPSLLMTNLDYGSMTTEIAFCTRTAGTSKPTVIVSGSKFNNVKSDTQSNVFISADIATINGYQFIPGPSFPNDNLAKDAGLIINNIYYNTTTNSMKKIT